MVRPMNLTSGGAWKPALAVAVVAAGLIWHVIACTESPMAFSPSGKDLAFTTMEPYDAKGEILPQAGLITFRLMVVSGARQLRIIEETRDAMLTAPAYSPDGQRLAYLRIPLFTGAQLEKIMRAVEGREKLSKEIEDSGSSDALPPAAAGEPAPGIAEQSDDLTLPPWQGAAQMAMAMAAATYPPRVPALLVVRDAATDKVLSLTRLSLLIGEFKGAGFLMTYMLARPQFSPDGKVVYISAANMVQAIDPAAKKERLLAAPAVMAALSPDGALLATMQEKTLGILRTDGQSAIYRRWESAPGLSGMAWVDKQTLAILKPSSDASPLPSLDLLRPDGTLIKTVDLEMPSRPGGYDSTGELAIAPDGRHMVISYMHDVFFMTFDGKVLQLWHNDDDTLVQPSFTPDSKQVAFKGLSKQKQGETDRGAFTFTWIAYFTPDGKEVTRVGIPAPKAPPAPAAPAKEPAEAKPAGQ